MPETVQAARLVPGPDELPFYTAGLTLVALISSFNLFLIAIAIGGSGFGMDSA